MTNQTLVDHLYNLAVLESWVMMASMKIQSNFNTGLYTEKWINLQYLFLAKKIWKVYLDANKCSSWNVDQTVFSSLAQRLRNYHDNFALDQESKEDPYSLDHFTGLLDSSCNTPLPW